MTSTIKSKASVIRENEDFKTLINAVVNQLGDATYIEDINRNGIGGGYPGFTYYSDTHAFAMKYRKAIVSLLERDADDFGEEVVNMVSHFGVFCTSPMDNEDRRELYRYLGGGKCDQSTITNLMAWYAAETVCRWFEQ